MGKISFPKVDPLDFFGLEIMVWTQSVVVVDVLVNA